MSYLLKPNLLIFLIIFFIPAVNLTQRLSLDLSFFALIFLLSNSKISKDFVIVLFPIFLCFAYQDFQFGSFNNLLEIGRFLPILSTILLLKYFKESYQYEYLFILLLVINFLFCFLNYFYLSDWMVNNGFNIVSYENAYGRNSGAVASFTTLALLSFANIFIGLSSSRFIFKFFCILLGLVCLFISGSKTFIAASFLYIFIFFFRNSLKLFIHPLQGLVTIIFIFLSITLIFSLASSEQFQVLYQLERLLYFVQFLDLGSVDARFFIWETYFSSQSQKITFLLFGTPKELLQEFSGTFDSDFVYYFVRLGIFIFSIILIIYFYFLSELFRKKAFQEFYFLGLVFLASIFIGISTDIQASIVLCLIVLYFKEKTKT